MNLNIEQMLVGPPARLRYVHRFSTCRTHHCETVAEHSFYVAFYALMIGKWCRSCGVLTQNTVPGETQDEAEIGDLLSLVQRALLHDLDEAVTGDVPRPFKYSSPELRKLWETASQQAFESVMEPVVGDADGFTVAWLDAKDGSNVGKILKFSDFLAVLGFMIEERESGNHAIQRHVEHVEKYLKMFESADFEFLRPLVLQARDMMRRLITGSNLHE